MSSSSVRGRPARAAALSALRVRPGASVLLLDRADFPRDKSCGDGIAPQVLDVLAALGLRRRRGRLRPGEHAVHRLPAGPGRGGVRAMARPARVVPRAGARRPAGRRRPRRGCGPAPPHRAPSRGAPRPGGARRRPVRADGGGRRRRRVHAPARAGPPAERARPRRRRDPRLRAGARRPARGAADHPRSRGLAGVRLVVPRSATAGQHRVRRRAARGAAAVALAAAGPAGGAAARASRADAHSWRAHHLPLSSSRPRQPDGRVLLVATPCPW